METQPSAPATDVYREAMQHYATLEVAAPARLEAWLDAVIRIERAQVIIRRGLRRLAFRDTAREVDAILAELRAAGPTRFSPRLRSRKMGRDL
jgi:hypothetical protein